MVPHRDPHDGGHRKSRSKPIGGGQARSLQGGFNFFITSDQFRLALDGIMLRKPAANFYMGSYFAEALRLASLGPGHQIAGTLRTISCRSSVTTCDYVDRRELYAAALPPGGAVGHALRGFLAGAFNMIGVGIVLATVGVAVPQPDLVFPRPLRT